jgi:Na+/H+-dicarboxylate symporter
MAKNEILQIVIFSIFFGTGAAAMGARASRRCRRHRRRRPRHAEGDRLRHELRAARRVRGGRHVIAKSGAWACCGPTASSWASFYLGSAMLWVVLIGAGFCSSARASSAAARLREPTMMAFTSPRRKPPIRRRWKAWSVSACLNRMAAFVLPIGYSFNLDGSMMYCTFATVFIAQAYGIEMSLGTQLTMLLVLMLTSKGMAGVPRASLVVIAATLNQFNIPEAGLLLMLGIDHFLDMGRSATNVIGNGIATAVVAKWEAL